MKTSTKTLLPWARTLGAAVPAQAALQRRLPATPGGTDDQAHCGTVLDITWTADANLAATNTFRLAAGTPLCPYPGNSTGLGSRVNTGGTGDLRLDGVRLPRIVDVGDDGCHCANTGADCDHDVLTGSAANSGQVASFEPFRFTGRAAHHEAP